MFIGTYNSNAASNSNDRDHQWSTRCPHFVHVGVEEEVWHDEPHGQNHAR